MKVLLMERIEKLGQMGDVVTVKNGYARNYLLPTKKAIRATDENQKIFEQRRAQLETQNLERRTEAEEIAGRMSDVSVVLIRQASDSGQLYGSVTARDIAQSLTEAGYTTEKRQIVLVRPIKTLGIHVVGVQLHPEVDVVVKANVARSEDEAQAQSEGRSLTSEDEDEDDQTLEIEEVFDDASAVELTEDGEPEETDEEPVS